MKRFTLMFFLLFLYGILSPVAITAEGNRNLAISYTGSVKGEFEPCAS